MTSPTRGRRNPELLGTPTRQSDPEQSEIDTTLAEQMEAEEHDQELLPETTLFAGDVVTHSVTLAVDYGDGRTNFIRSSATTRVQEGEHALATRARLLEHVNAQVIEGVDDARVAIEQYAVDLAEFRERVSAELER